jgi:hypothetical protein
MIALPFAPPSDSPFQLNYRLLVNQYNEVLNFFLVDKGVPNRGIGPVDGELANTDQTVVALDYEQGIRQIVAGDFPQIGLAGAQQLPIHHEPGLLLNMLDRTDGGPSIARLATIPHGDAALALGAPTVADGPPDIPTVNALPIGVNQDIETNPYLAPYKHFHDNLFEDPFDPTDPTALLNTANEGVDIIRTTKLEFDTTVASGGINNIPFIVAQANASEMKATFWIQDLAETDDAGNPRLRLQYVQVVQLDFFPRVDGGPGRIKWPHVSINTLEKQGNIAPERPFTPLP